MPKAWIGKVNGKSIEVASEDDAAKILAIIERHDPDGVERGDYFIDVDQGEGEG